MFLFSYHLSVSTLLSATNFGTCTSHCFCLGFLINYIILPIRHMSRYVNVWTWLYVCVLLIQSRTTSMIRNLIAALHKILKLTLRLNWPTVPILYMFTQNTYKKINLCFHNKYVKMITNLPYR